jgi:hypothetical protein
VIKSKEKEAKTLTNKTRKQGNPYNFNNDDDDNNNNNNNNFTNTNKS